MTAPLRHSDPITVDVALGERAYDIVIGRDVLQTLGSRIAALRPGVRTAIVTDRTVAKHWLEKAEASLAQAGIAASRIIVDEGEVVPDSGMHPDVSFFPGAGVVISTGEDGFDLRGQRDRFVAHHDDLEARIVQSEAARQARPESRVVSVKRNDH